MTSITKLYLRQFTFGLVGFVLVLILGMILHPFIYQSYQQKIVLMLAVFPGIYAGMNLARALMSLDEMQQRIQLEAIGFSLANTVFVAVILGILQVYSMDYFNMACMIPIIVGGWGLGVWMTRRRYQ